MTQNLKWLYWARGLRSFSTAFLTVAFPLYLAVSGYNAARLGLVLGVSGGVSLLLVAAAGIIGDKYGRRSVIMGLAALAAIGGAVLTRTVAFWPVVLASGLGGVGKGGGAGSGGSFGPVFPAEQPLVAGAVHDSNRTKAFGAISFVGVMAGAAGSLVAAVPEILHSHGWTWAASYQLLFAASVIIALAMVAVSIPLRENPPTQTPVTATDAPPISFKQLLGRLGFTNALNGLGFGFLGPLLTYWFYRRYGVGPAELGVLYTVINLASALPYLWSSTVAARLGAVRTVTYTRALGLLVLLSMAVCPTFVLAGIAYMLRMIFNSLGMPARQSFVMGVSDDRHRSRVSAFSSLPAQITGMVSPVAAGALMDAVLDIPIFGATLFMGLNLVAYYWLFRDVRPPEEQSPARMAGGST